MDSWTKIQSGSIYYALAKLEKEGLIELTAEENVGAKARKIYSITDKGRSELVLLVAAELNSPIGEAGSDKFILYPLLSVCGRDEIEKVISSHIAELEKKMDNIRRWQQIKVNSQTLEVERISFEMMISNIDYQIRWHQALLSQLDQCIESSEEVARVIKMHDFTNAAIVSSDSVTDLGELVKQTLNI